MKLLQLIFCFYFSLIVALAQQPFGNHDGSVTNGTQKGQAALQLTTSIAKQHNCVEAGSTFQRWTLHLIYTNSGDQPILLDRKSSLIYKSMISSSLQAASDKRYEHETSFTFVDLSKAGMRAGVPTEDAFITLKPGDSYNLETDFGVRLYDGTEDSEDFLRSGKHFLQVRVATWYYFAQPEDYQKQWRDKGYLWFQNMTSLPMPFTVEKQPATMKCL